MKVRFKKLSKEAVVPKKAYSTDAGFDLVGTRVENDENGCEVWHTDLAVEIPEGYVGYIFPRSSISKYNRVVANSVGVVDAGYRGEVTVKMHSMLTEVLPTDSKTWEGKSDEEMNTANLRVCHWWNADNKKYKVGDRIAQIIIMPIPNIEFEEVGELSDGERGINGYGSTGE